MELDTKYFGPVRCAESSVLEFPDGIFGFEDQKQFVLLPFDESGGSMLCFQSVVTAQLAFVAVNPFFLTKKYAPVLNKKELAMMGVTCSEDLCYYTLCVVKEPLAKSTVNLRCPVVINDETRQARQFILDQYKMRHLLSDFAGNEEVSC